MRGGRGRPRGEEAGLARALDVDARLARAMAMGVPAFVRRAQELEAATRGLFCRIAAERERRLEVLLVAARRVEAARLAGAVLPAEARACLDVLRAHPAFARRPCAPPRSPGRVFRALSLGVERFNRRWLDYLHAVPIDGMRELQARYNRYYPLEREMALRDAPPLSFQPLKLLERGDLVERFPPLPGGEAGVQ